MKKPFAKSAALSFAVAALMNAQAFAQDEESDKKESLLEYVLVVGDSSYLAKESKTASRINVSLEEIPLNVQAVTSEVVADFQLVSQRDALQMHAAVDGKKVRGFSTSEFFRNGFLHLSDSPGFTIERVEVVRGPNAVLNGPVTPGGAINTITKHARVGEDAIEIGGYLGFSDSTGTHNRENLGLDVDFHKTNEDETFAFRFVGGYQNDTGFGSPVDNEMKAFMPSIQWKPSDSTVVDFEYYNYNINSDRADRAMGIEMTAPIDRNGKTIQVPVAELFDNIYALDSFFQKGTDINESLSDYTFKISHSFGERVLVSAGYNSHNRDFEFGPGNRPLLGMGSGPGAFGFFWNVSKTGMGADNDPSQWTLSRRNEELSLENAVENYNVQTTFILDSEQNHKIVVGFDSFGQDQALTIGRYRSSYDADGNFVGVGQGDREAQSFPLSSIDAIQQAWDPAAHGFAPDIQLRRDRDVKQTNSYLNYHGVFFDGHFNVLVGLSANDIYMGENKFNAGCLDVLPDCGPVPAAEDRVIFDDGDTLTQVGAVYYIDSDQTYGLYANFSESQLPDLNDPDFDADPPLRKGEQTEFGIKFNGLIDGAMNINLGIYEITQDTTAENDTSRTGEASGVDFDMSWLPTDNTSVMFSIATVDTEVTKSTNAEEIGRPLLDETDMKWSLWAKHDFTSGWLENFSIGGGYIYTGERVRRARFPKNEWLIMAADGTVSTGGAGEALRYDPSTRMDVFAKYSGEDYEVSLNLRNLTKEDNLSANVPRLPLQGGYDENGNPYTFDGEMEIMVGFRYFIK